MVMSQQALVDSYGAITVTYRKVPIEHLGEHYVKKEELLELKSRLNGFEFSLVQTCNRVELYYFSPNKEDVSERIFDALSYFHKGDIRQVADVFHGVDAVRHLFRLASGIDSISIGEYEILGQLREAIDEAVKIKSAGRLLQILFDRAIKAGREVRNTTDISRGKTGIYSLAYEYASAREDLRKSNIAVVGAGRFAYKTASFLINNGIKNITIYDRTLEKARQIASELGVRYAQLDLRSVALHDVVFVAIYSEEQKKLEGPRLIVDMSVPPAFNGENVITLEDLRTLSKIHAERRQSEIAKAEELVEKHVSQFPAFLNSYISSIYISSVMKRVHKIRESEVSRGLWEIEKIMQVNDKPKEEEVKQVLDAMSNSIVKKIMEPLLNRIKAEVEQGNLIQVSELASILGDKDNWISDSETKKEEDEGADPLPYVRDERKNR